MRNIALLLVGLMMALGCAGTPTVSPSDSDKRVERERGPTMEVTEADVTLRATSGTWRWNPTDLDQFVTPMLLEIENDSDRPVRIRFQDIRMVGDNGVYLAALPPYDIRGETTRTVQSHAYTHDGFVVAHHVHPYYPRHPRSRHHYYHDYYYYRTYHPVYQTYTIRLPTTDMLQRGLPEGVVEPGGRAMGFVYFQPVTRNIARRTATLDLLFQIIDAENQADLGVLSVGYNVRR